MGYHLVHLKPQGFTIFTTSSFKKKNVFSQFHVEYPPRDRPFLWICPRIFEDQNYAIPFVQGWVEKVVFPRGSANNSFTLPLWNKCSFHAINSAIRPPKTMRFKSLLSIENQYPLATSDFLKTTIEKLGLHPHLSQSTKTRWGSLPNLVRRLSRVQRVGPALKGVMC